MRKIQRDNLSGALIIDDNEQYIKAKKLQDIRRKKLREPSVSELLSYIKSLEKRIYKLEANLYGNRN